jgi:hypothetical protein
VTYQHDRAETTRYSSLTKLVARPDAASHGRNKHPSARNSVLFEKEVSTQLTKKFHAQVVEVKVYYRDYHNSTLDPMPIRFLVL